MKKRFVILIFFIVLIIVGIVLFSLLRKPAPDQTTIPPKTQLPAQEFTAAPPPQWGSRIQVENQDPSIKSAFLKETSRTIPPDQTIQFQAIYLNDNNNKLIPLPTLQSSLAFSIQPDLARMVDPNEYELFYCQNDPQKNMGMIIYLYPSMTEALTETDYQEAQTYLKQWEPSMLKDLHTILFPTTTFSDETLASPLVFNDGKSRYVEIDMPDGTKRSINYRMGGSPIVFATSLQCLEDAENYFFDTQEE